VSSTLKSARVVLSTRQIWIVFGGLMLGSFLSSLDQTVVATALPTIVRDLGTAGQLSWVVTAYLLTSTVATGLWGKLSDLYGRKPVYLACTAIFLVGSTLAGLSQSMLELILFRGLQGVGGGGLLVLGQTVIGDVVSPRERGRYQGLFGAVFGVSSIAGPLVGGFLVDNFSWHWVFYINLPIGLVSLLVTALALPATSIPRRARIDWPGAALLTVGTTATVLLASLGGTTFAWSSPPIVGLGTVALTAVLAFLLLEGRAHEPILAPRLFARPVFGVAAVLSFAVGAILLGSISFLPSYLQIVKHATATASGLGLVPLIVGLLLTSTASGFIVSSTGRYKALPILGFGVSTVGLFLMSTMGISTPSMATSMYLFVLGFGLGLVMQVLTVAVQNIVSSADLGAATSGLSFFRAIGSVIGVAAFGAIYANALSASAAPGSVQAYADALHNVFFAVVPLGGLAFVLSWFLKEVPLRSDKVEMDAADSHAEVPRAA
jgi:EmrB/QacA subfamily drug resistance transporter